MAAINGYPFDIGGMLMKGCVPLINVGQHGDISVDMQRIARSA
jgi:hypothetical protein